MTVIDLSTMNDAPSDPPTADLQVGRRVQMQVRKRNGDLEPVDVNKIVRAVERCADELADVDPLRVATKTISGLYDGATTAELDRLSIQTAAELVAEEPAYSRLPSSPPTSTRRSAGKVSRRSASRSRSAIAPV